MRGVRPRHRRRGAIPDEDWDRATKTTADILRRKGYDRVEVTLDEPGQHEATFDGDYGSTLTVSGQRSTSFELTDSGCFLTADAHESAAAVLPRAL